MEPTADTTTADSVQPPFAASLQQSLKRVFQRYLDASVPYIAARWVLLCAAVAVYGLRVYFLAGFYIVTYGLGIFLLNLLIGFLSPIEDMEEDGPMLPVSSADEYKPFIRRLPEFKFWYSCIKAVCIGFVITFFPMFDIPVFWPILLVYFIILFVLTMKKQIKHMIKHRYVPFSLGKKKYGGISGPTVGDKEGPKAALPKQAKD